MLKDKKEYENEDDIDLTDMINEYSEDNELRRKIDALKKQKEEALSAAIPNKPKSVLDQLSEMGDKETYKEGFNTENKSSMPNITVDDTMIDKSRVGYQDDDKTLIIMDQKKQTRFDSAFDTQVNNDNKTAVFHMDEQNDGYDYEDEDVMDDDDNLLSRMQERRKDKEATEKSGNDDGSIMNKVITYVILGIVGICIIVGAFFGIKYVAGHFFGNSTKTKEVKPKEVKPEETPTKTEDEQETAKPKKSISDNSAQIAQLNKQLETYQKQLDQVNKDITSTQSDVDSAQKVLDDNNCASNASYLNTYLAQLVAIKAAQAKVDDATKVLLDKSNIDDATKAKATSDLAAGNAELAIATQNGTYDEVKAKIDKIQSDNTMTCKPASDKKDTATSKLNDLNTKKTNLESSIADATTELGKYNK